MKLGVINLLKPPGMSSAQAVAFIKRLSGLKAGHVGTLDPEAAGVLPILLGRATRIADYLIAGPKVYLAEIAFGAATDTQDAQGHVISRGESHPDKRALLSVLPRFTGSISQLPPQFSALKLGGTPAYKLARSGRKVDLTPRETEVDSITLLQEMPEHGFLMRIVCGKGTYIRTLCHDIGQALGCPAHMRLLIREESSYLSIHDACTVEELREVGRENMPRYLLSVEKALDFLPGFQVPVTLLHLLAGGVCIAVNDRRLGDVRPPAGPFRMYAGNAFLGIFEALEGSFRAKCMLYQP